MRGRKRELMLLAGLVSVAVLAGGGWVLYDRFGPLPPCPQATPQPGAAEARKLTPAESAAVVQTVNADPALAQITGGQVLKVEPLARYDEVTGVTDGAAQVSWTQPVTAPAPLFLGVSEDQQDGRWTNVTRVLVSVDLQRRAVYAILPGPEATSEGVKFERADCAADH